MARICLINPRFQTSFWGLNHGLPLLVKKSHMPVLALPTLAGLTPPEHEVVLVDENIEEIERIFHAAGALMYYDGANLNAVCGISRPGDIGFDIVHINLHKTFSTPHGGGGPGAGPVVFSEALAPFAPTPRLVRDGEGWRLDEHGQGQFAAALDLPYVRALGFEHPQRHFADQLPVQPRLDLACGEQ